jgi:glycerol uptake facilitator-like aquaporin
MNNTNTAQIEKLMQINQSKYQLAGHLNPAVAAAFAVEGILNQYKTQPEYLTQLLAEEIEDAEKAFARASAGK